jgi:hypothetical protein
MRTRKIKRPKPGCSCGGHSSPKPGSTDPAIPPATGIKDHYKKMKFKKMRNNVQTKKKF